MEDVQNVRETLKGTQEGSILIGQRVEHTKFQTGTIINVGTGKLTIDFEEYGIKLLQYPEVFEKLLKLTNKDTEVLQLISEDRNTLETAIDERRSALNLKVAQSTQKVKRISIVPMVTKVPLCFGEICSSYNMDWNVRQRGCMCSHGVCGLLGAKNGLEYEEIKEQLDYGSHVCISQLLYNNGVLELGEEIEVTTEQIVVFIAYPLKGKAVDRIILGLGSISSAQRLEDKGTTLIQFDKSKLLLLNEMEAMETNFNSALNGKRAQQLMFSTYKKLTIPETIEIICQIKDVLEPTDERFKLAVEFIEQLIELKREEDKKPKRGPAKQWV